MTSVAVIMLTYFCANIMLGLGLLKRHEDLVAQREKHEQFTRECEERMKKWEHRNHTLANIQKNLTNIQKKYEEKQNKFEPILSPPHGIDIESLRRVNKIYGTDYDEWLKRQQDWLMNNRDEWEED